MEQEAMRLIVEELLSLNFEYNAIPRFSSRSHMRDFIVNKNSRFRSSCATIQFRPLPQTANFQFVYF